jgi:dihydrolipoamide dehydrogenase
MASCGIGSLNMKVRAVDYEMDAVVGALLHTDGYSGHARIIVDEDRHVIVGATMIGLQVGDLLHSPTIAIVGEVPLERLWHAVQSFPTTSEVWLGLSNLPPSDALAYLVDNPCDHLTGR